MRDFDDKVVVITGGATGIGYALAKQFLSRGAKVVIAEPRRHKLDEAAASLTQGNDREVRVFECDVTQPEQVEALADFVEQEFGQADVLVNNAGVGPVPDKVIDAKREDIQAVLDVNLFGVFNGVSTFGRRFTRQGTPSAIYNVGSENSFFNAVPGGAGYVLSKHAVLALTVALREEVPDNIEVGLIIPGLVHSELARETALGMNTDKYAELVVSQIEAGEFYIVSHSYSFVRMKSRWDEVEQAYTKYAPRYDGDTEYDVRTLGEKNNWYPDIPKHGVDHV